VSAIIRIEPEALRPAQVRELLGISERMLRDCDAAGWITACVRVKRLVLYRTGQCRLLLNRIEKEGPPPKRPLRNRLVASAKNICPAAMPSERPAPHPVSPATI
jgi:hypothetical protein